ncbi:hypothetical protein AB1Y20_001903 [Prymnesium parvum]|uniref:Amine oxidase n=1 Tax=Prymnesium parvum TaxID=97485 RepID=A0AB34J9E8_PRYPA
MKPETGGMFGGMAGVLAVCWQSPARGWLSSAVRGSTIRACDPPMSDGSLDEFSAELRRRGLRTALDELAADGPSAFKQPEKVVEYVMLHLQRRGVEGVGEAFRFTSPPGGKQSFVSGNPLSADRLSWEHGVVIEGYVSGRALPYEAFEEMVVRKYGLLLGCAVWDFAVVHPRTFAPCFREAEDGFVKETTLVVDDVPVAVRLVYDWGSWCYLIYSVQLLDGSEDAPLHDEGADAKRRNQRGRGGNI